MKEELQGKLVEILSSIQTAAGKASDFALEQLPDIAQSYVAYGRAEATVFVAVGLVVFCLGFLVLSRVKRRHDAATAQYEKDLELYRKGERDGRGEPYRERYFEAGDLFPFPYLPFIVGGVLFFASMSQFLLVWLAPKVWLLKEIARLVK